MEVAEYDTMARLEDGYWWYLGLRRLVQRALELELGHTNSPRVLDAGCGTGGGIIAASRFFQDSLVVGADVAPQAIDHCQRRGIGPLVRGSVHHLPFKNETFDVVLAIDLISTEGVCEDPALQEASRVLGPGGVLVINVPAFKWLRGGHDRVACIRHRYRRSEVERLLVGHGFTVQRIQYWNALVLPAVFVVRRFLNPDRKGMSARSDLDSPPRWLNRMLIPLLQFDAWICRVFRIPFGTSVFGVAHRDTDTVKHGTELSDLNVLVESSHKAWEQPVGTVSIS